MNNKTITSNKSVIANGFNSFFVNVGTNLAKTIPSDPRSPEIYMTRNPCSMVLLPTENNEVIIIIKNLKTNSPGWDAVVAKVVKASYASFIEPLTYIKSFYQKWCGSHRNEVSESDTIVQDR